MTDSPKDSPRESALPRYTRSMSLDHLLPRLKVQLRELASFRDLRRQKLGPAAFRAADGTEATLEVGDPWPSRAWPVGFTFDVEIPGADLGGAPDASDGASDATGRDSPPLLHFDVGGEGLLTVAGQVLGGLNPWHREYPLPSGALDAGAGGKDSADPSATESKSIRIEIEAVPKAPFAVAIREPVLRAAHLVFPDRQVRAVHDDLAAALDAAETLAENRPDVAALLADAVAETFLMIRLPRHDAHAYLSRLSHEPESRDTLETVWEEWSFDAPPIALDSDHRATLTTARGALADRIAAIRERYPSEGELWLSGHAHLDLAWLWPLEETRRKARRTFQTVLGLLDRYPEWTFNQSMAQLYAYLEEDDPEAFDQIRTRVEEGRWEVVGGMWVEPDGNLLSGESWARQLLMGQRYLQERLGTRASVAWLPDTFGYAANLPQLLRQAGMKWFFTTKLNWSETNRFPHDLYWWEGLDGSRVLAHSFNNRKRNYNGVIDAADTTDVWRRFRGKRHARASLFTFGWGDGGGGPTAEMLERAERQAEMPGLPHLRHARVDAFYEHLEATTDTHRLPVWVGEKYLEFHRGTYTSQAEVKRLHRRLEHELVEAEAAAALAWRNQLGAYPAAELASLWRVLARNQFHDILPGSSVETVNEEAERELGGALAEATRIRNAWLGRLAAHLLPESAADAPERWLVWNPTLDDRPLHAELPEGAVGASFGGEALPVARMGDRVWVHAPDVMVPGLGWVVLQSQAALEPAGGPDIEQAVESAAGYVRATPERLENDALAVEILPDGCIRVFDKEHDRWAVGDPGNALWAYTDIPRDFEAWEIDADYAATGSKLPLVGTPEVLSAGPVSGSVKVRRSGAGFEVEQEYRLWAGSRRLEIHTRVVAHGRRSLLRTEFPLSVRSPRATFETAFGAVDRPTHRNTPWDAAKFEVPGLRWADLSEPGYGVSLLTDAKYGYAAHGSTLSLSLLRGPVYPDPYADLGEHQFVYALYPHAGDWREGTVAEAHDLNAPLRAVPTTTTSTTAPGASAGNTGADTTHSSDATLSGRWLDDSTGGLRLSALKRSEDGASLIARLYEPHGKRGTARIAGVLGRATHRLDLLEERVGAVEDGEIAYGPYEVITVELA